jgi:hypothetical protein
MPLSLHPSRQSVSLAAILGVMVASAARGDSAATGGSSTGGPAPSRATMASAANRARAAIPEFEVEGETSPALVIVLQDGFVVGLTRAGVQVLDSVDVRHRLVGHPELEKCDTSLCLKRLGELLDVRYLLRVRVNVAGNSYRMTARLFHTEGTGAAALPALTQSRFCDVCTVVEAREVMIRLADAVRKPFDEAPMMALAMAPSSARPSLLPLVALGTGLVALAGGAALYLASGRTSKTTPALGGALMGAGVSIAGMSAYLMFIDAAGAPPAMAVAWRW